MDREEIKEYKESLSQIKKMMTDTLLEEELSDYVIQEVEQFL